MLEFKLTSIDGLPPDTKPPQLDGEVPALTEPANASVAAVADESPPEPCMQPTDAEAAEATAPVVMAKDHPRFIRYFKMLNYGVPLPVVAGKLQMEEGIDPVILNSPNALVPEESPSLDSRLPG